MKHYRVVKAWPGVEVGDYYQHMGLDELLKGGWIEQVSEGKTLEEKFIKECNEAPSGISTHLYYNKLSLLAKSHYLELLDEADVVWDRMSMDDRRLWGEYHGYFKLLRKYLESEGKI